VSQVVIAWYSWLSSLTQGPILVILGTALPLLALAAVVSLGGVPPAGWPAGWPGGIGQ